MTLPIALQLWSVNEDLKNDFQGTLDKISKMGYAGVEFAGYHGKTAKEVKEILTKLDLRVAGSHISMEQILHQTEEVIAFEKELGNRYVICPWATFDSLEEWKKFAVDLEKAAKRLSKADLKLVYHNHAHEFTKLQDEYILDILLNSIPSDLLQAELDVYWLEYAGVNIIEYMENYQERTPLIHVKDMAHSKKESTEVGNGILDIKAIVRQAMKNKTEWLVIEQEAFTKPPLESVEIGIKNLKKTLADIA